MTRKQTDVLRWAAGLVCGGLCLGLGWALFTLVWGTMLRGALAVGSLVVVGAVMRWGQGVFDQLRGRLCAGVARPPIPAHALEVRHDAVQGWYLHDHFTGFEFPLEAGDIFLLASPSVLAKEEW